MPAQAVQSSGRIPEGLKNTLCSSHNASCFVACTGDDSSQLNILKHCHRSSGVDRTDVSSFLTGKQCGSRRSILSRMAPWPPATLVCSVFLLHHPSTSFHPQHPLLCKLAAGTRATFQSPGGVKVEGHLECHFPGAIKHFVSLHWPALVPGPHLDKVCLRNGVLLCAV